ncbi:transcription antitermination factor NusB [candidate division KSB1 bacterium]|nr:transcription antitermination factor NusB [candidate division KSB1 bacterium]
MGKRRKARELVLQGLYALEVSDNPIKTVIEEIEEQDPDPTVQEFACDLLRKTVHNHTELDEVVSKSVKNWNFDRIAIIDRLILRQSLCELMHFEEIPPKVTINEAIDLAKKFSTAESGRFVNGILDAVLKQLKTEDKISKSGRGLMDGAVK